MTLRIETEEQGDTLVLAVGGEIDLATAPTLRDALADAIAREPALVLVDLEAVGFLDSAGLGVILGALRRLRAQGADLEVVCTSRNLLNVFEITGLDRSLTIRAAREPAA